MKLAVKLLSKTDLTLFEPFFRLNPEGAQKGINLNAAPFRSMYPRLPQFAEDGLPVTADIFGPGGASMHRIATKLTKAPPKAGKRGAKGAKNWRVSGGVVFPEPAGEAGRYSSFAIGDVAVFGFSGDPLPEIVQMVLFAKGAGEPDAEMVRRFTSSLGLKQRVNSMVEISPGGLEDLTRDLPSGHPVHFLVRDRDRDDELLEAAAGDEEASSHLYTRAKTKRTRPPSWEEMAAADARNREIGRRGEEIVNYLLEKEQAAGTISSFVWEAKDNAASPYDFSVVEASGETTLLDVKTTPSGFETRFFLSTFEAKAATGSEPYKVFRIYDLEGPSGPKLRRSHDITAEVQTLLDALTKLPEGFGVASVTIETDALDWAPEEDVALPPPPPEPED